MRNLTITRNKTFVGCLMKLKVCIEDPIMGDITIGDARCRKIGELKNGETKTFSIEENETRVFVIADMMSKNYCNEFCTIPAGSNDVFLSGQPRYNPASGNAFRFDGQADEAMLANRRKGTKRGLIIFVAALVIGFAIGIASALLDRPEPKRFEVLDGFAITLTDEFESEQMEYDWARLSIREALVDVYRYGFDEAPLASFATMTEEEYGEFMIEMFALDGVEMESHGDSRYFEYAGYADDGELYIMHVVFKGSDAFWSVEFVCFADEQNKWNDQFWEWVDTIEIP